MVASRMHWSEFGDGKIERAKKVIRRQTNTLCRIIEDLPIIKAGAQMRQMLAIPTPRSDFHFFTLAADARDEILTPQELAERLKVSVSWIFEQTRKRAGVRSKDPLPHYKEGKLLRFSWFEVVAWLNRHSRGGQSSATQGAKKQ